MKQAPRIGFRRFRSQLQRAVLVSILVAMGVTVLGLVVIELWLNDQKLEQDVDVLADILGNRSLAALQFEDADAATRNLEAARYDKHVDGICLFRPNGSLLAHYARSQSFNCNEHQPHADDRYGAAHLQRSKELKLHEEVVGNIVVVASRKKILQGVIYFLPLALTLVPLVFLLTATIIQRTVRRTVRPLEDLHQTAQTLMDNSQSSRRVIRTSDDEVGELVGVFNRMLDSLAVESNALQASEIRFRTLTAHAPIGIFQLDKDFNLVYANDVWYQLTGITGERNPFTVHLEHIVPEDAVQYRARLAHALEREASVRIEYRYQFTKQAKARHLLENVTPLHAGASLDGLIGTLADVTEIKLAQKELEKLAFYDPLTDLPNRRFFRDLLTFGLAKAKRGHTKAAVLMLDMDNFKRVNDLLGHAGGDELLREQSKRIRMAVRDHDAVSRMGGDEFTIFLSQVREISEVSALAKRVIDAINAPLVIGNHTLEVGTSIGVALYPADGETVEDLMRNADMALYEAKAAGRNRVNFFSFKLDLELRENIRIEQKLKLAIRDRALMPYLQTQVNSEGQVIWAEALCRWNDPEDGMIGPDRFIPLAEETGLIQGVGQLMLEQVCFHLAKHRQYLQLQGIHGISVNLSGRQFYNRGLVQEIRGTMEKFGVDPRALEFELTESVVMDDIQIAIDIMREIRDLGCRISIDDFGTGYSSLSYLKRFPINTLKIDRSFVEDIPHDTYGMEIATAIIAMAHKLHLDVVAEGVETEAQRDFLVAQGCECMQGYLFGKQPIHIQEYVNMGRAISSKRESLRAAKREQGRVPVDKIAAGAGLRGDGQG